jgi:Na+-translocating ferredoxin:NAD+ oxidoreductase subunit B
LLNNDIFRQLQKHLDNAPEGFPAVTSGADIRILKRLFDPEEALVATHLSPVKPLTVGTIQRRLRQSGIEMKLARLRSVLATMARKGTILSKYEGYSEVRYQNAGASAGGIIDFQVNRLSPELVADIDEYHVETFSQTDNTGKHKLLPLRTVPVQKSIPLPEKHLLATYEDVRHLISQAPGPLAVANCICRQTRDIRGQKCQYTALRETCLQIGPDHARQYIEMGIARSISRDEALDILSQAEHDGLILQPENSQKPEAICCCCSDCCAVITAVTRLPHPSEHYCSN